MKGVIDSDISAGIACSRIRYGHSSAVPTLTTVEKHLHKPIYKSFDGL